MDEKLFRPAVSGIKEYKPGKNPEKPGVIKLASNENPFGPSLLALAAIEKEAKKLQVYPDQKASLLREALGKKFGIGPACIIAGNGSDDIMQIIGATFLCPGEEVVIPKNTFSVYELVSRIFDGKIVLADLKDNAVDLDAIAAAVTEKTKVVFVANPNNPTGTCFTQKELDAFLQKIPARVLVVIDEAYAEFAEAPDLPNSIEYVKQGKSVIVLRTFSKFYGLAGLRAGYGIAAPELVSAMLKVKMPFNVSRLAQVAAAAALEDKKFCEKTFKNNAEGKNYLYQELSNLRLAYKKTEANFIFIDVKRDADALFLQLMAEGVIIRPLTSFGFPEAIRASIGIPAQNEKLVSALKRVFQNTA